MNRRKRKLLSILLCVSLILSTWAIWFRPMHVSASEDNSIEDLVGFGQPKQGNGALRMTTTPTPTWSAPTQSPSRTPTPYPPLTMPDVVGMNYVDAMDLIREKLAPPVFDEIKFQIGWALNNDPNRTLTVATQEPQAGSLQYGNHSSRTFKLVVYEHAPTPTITLAPTNTNTPTPLPPATMPNVVGMDYRAAMRVIREALEPFGFGMGEIEYVNTSLPNNDAYKSFLVNTQDPAAGTLLYANGSKLTVNMEYFTPVTQPSVTPRVSPSKTATPTPDYSGYTVTLLPGEGTGEPVVYRFDDQETILGWKAAGSYQFYYEDNGDLGFKSSFDRFPDSFTPPEGYLFDGFQNGAYHVLKQKETTITAEWKCDTEYWKDVPDADFELSPDEFQLTGGGNSEFTIGFKSFCLGRVPVGGERLFGDDGEIDVLFYRRAQSLELYPDYIYVEDFELANENGDTIPFSIGFPDQDGESEETDLIGRFSSDKDTFSFSVFVDPDDFKNANPGEYSAYYYFNAYWNVNDPEDMAYGTDQRRVLLKLVVPEPDLRPSVPTSVKANAVSASSIRITWEANEEAEGYQVWRSTSETGSFTNLGTITENEKLSVGLKANTTYYYKVRAYRQIDGTKYYSDFTPVISAETLLAKPVGVKAASASGTSVKVTWNAVAGADGYQVWRGLSSTGSFTALGSFNTTEKVSTGLVTGTTYYYKVRAYKVVEGKKVYSDYSAVVSAAPKLSAPSGVKAVPDTTTGINISWNKLSGATGYQVWRGTSATGTFTAIGSVTTTSRVSTGLKAGTTYYYKVRAYKEVDGKKIYGDFSAVVSASTKPSAPSGVKAVVASATKVKVSWNASNGAAGYEVWRSDSASGTYTKLGTVTTTSRDCPGLTKGKTYHFKVRAYVEVNGTKYYSNYSSVVSATPKA